MYILNIKCTELTTIICDNSNNDNEFIKFCNKNIKDKILLELFFKKHCNNNTIINEIFKNFNTIYDENTKLFKISYCVFNQKISYELQSDDQFISFFDEIICFYNKKDFSLDKLDEYIVHKIYPQQNKKIIEKDVKFCHCFLDTKELYNVINFFIHKNGIIQFIQIFNNIYKQKELFFSEGYKISSNMMEKNINNIEDFILYIHFYEICIESIIDNYNLLEEKLNKIKLISFLFFLDKNFIRNLLQQKSFSTSIEENYILYLNNYLNSKDDIQFFIELFEKDFLLLEDLIFILNNKFKIDIDKIVIKNAFNNSLDKLQIAKTIIEKLLKEKTKNKKSKSIICRLLQSKYFKPHTLSFNMTDNNLLIKFNDSSYIITQHWYIDFMYSCLSQIYPDLDRIIDYNPLCVIILLIFHEVFIPNQPIHSKSCFFLHMCISLLVKEHFEQIKSIGFLSKDLLNKKIISVCYENYLTITDSCSKLFENDILKRIDIDLKQLSNSANIFLRICAMQYKYDYYTESNNAFSGNFEPEHCCLYLFGLAFGINEQEFLSAVYESNICSIIYLKDKLLILRNTDSEQINCNINTEKTYGFNIEVSNCITKIPILHKSQLENKVDIEKKFILNNIQIQKTRLRDLLYFIFQNHINYDQDKIQTIYELIQILININPISMKYTGYDMFISIDFIKKLLLIITDLIHYFRCLIIDYKISLKNQKNSEQYIKTTTSQYHTYKLNQLKIVLNELQNIKTFPDLNSRLLLEPIEITEITKQIKIPKKTKIPNPFIDLLKNNSKNTTYKKNK